ncbi:hypothetical protein COOONC_25548 [Cooperia oncophora]
MKGHADLSAMVEVEKEVRGSKAYWMGQLTKEVREAEDGTMKVEESGGKVLGKNEAFEEIYRLKKHNGSVDEPDNDQTTVEVEELRHFASTIRLGGTELERRTEEMARKLISEQIERIRLSRSNTALRRRCARAEHVMRRARDRMVVVETQAGKRCAQLQYQLDTALIDLAGCQSQLVRSIPIEKYEKLAVRYKKECVAEVLDSELDEVPRENVISIACVHLIEGADELEAKETRITEPEKMFQKIVEVLSEQNDFWSKETEILANETKSLNTIGSKTWRTKATSKISLVRSHLVERVCQKMNICAFSFQ